MNGVIAGAMLTASALWLWPFGDNDEPVDKHAPPEEQTLSSLQGQAIDLPPDEPMAEPAARARESYRAFLQLSGADPELAAEATRRLADLELDAAERKALESGADQLPADAYKGAIALYEQLLERNPDYVHNDMVLYQLSRAQESGGDPVAALATLDTLVARYPETDALDEIQFRRGEILFAQGQYASAENAYGQVLAVGPESDFYNQSLYKQGWSRYKLAQYESALDAFFGLLDLRLGSVPDAELPGYVASLSRPERELLDDTMRVMSMSFIDMDGEATLSAQLQQRQDPDYGYLLYASLGERYLEQERYTDAAQTMSGFASAHPLHDRAPSFVMQAVAALEKGGFVDSALAMREEYVDQFGFGQPWWAGREKSDYEPEVDYLRESVSLFALRYHAIAQKAKPAERAEKYAQAAAGYRRFLDYFPDDPQAPEMHFLLGETLYEGGDYFAAVAAYEAAAYDYPAHERADDAGYAALVAYEKFESQLNGDAQRAWQRRRLDSSLKFAETFPQSEHALIARIYAAEGYYADGNLKAALRAADGVIDDPSATARQRRIAWGLVADIRFDQEEYVLAESAYSELRAIDAANGKVDPEIEERLAASIYKQGEQAREAGDALEAAALFKRVGETVPGAAIAETADYDAAMATLSAKQTAVAIPMLESFRSSYPSSEFNEQVTQSLALAYIDEGRPIDAAEEFRRIADSKASSPAVRQEALWRAAELYRDNGDPAAASQTMVLYVQRYPEDFDKAVEVQQYQIGVAQARGDRAAQLALSRKLVEMDASAGAKRSERSKYLAAKASLALAEPARDDYRAINLTLPLNKSLPRKQKALEAALNAYAKTTEYGVAEVNTEATYQTAELYHELANSLYRAERPANLGADVVEEYNLLIDEQALPFEEKAIELHEANVRRAAEGTFDDSVAKSFAALAQLNPGRYSRPVKEDAFVEAIR